MSLNKVLLNSYYESGSPLVKKTNMEFCLQRYYSTDENIFEKIIITEFKDITNRRTVIVDGKDLLFVTSKEAGRQLLKV